MLRITLLRGLRLLMLSAFLSASGPTIAGEQTTQPQPQTAVRGLIERLLPSHADQFVLESISKENDLDVFEVETIGGRVVVRGSSGVAIASGVNWYLHQYCHCEVSWCGDQLNLPQTLPAVTEKIRRSTPFKYRYFFNYCAFSYTMAWWDWPQWERMIDWMALHGINMPLSVTGQEAVWQAVYRKLGLSDAEIGQFLVGPAYLPFGWMGCMDGWGGPLPQNWIDRHRELESRIVARQRELGMTPVLQGFTGHVPIALKNKFPKAGFRQLPSWAGFPGTYFLDPLDPLFRQIGRAFIEEQTRLFGTNHLYASDTFIEMSPPSNDLGFLRDMGAAVFGAMKEADPEAVWVMQGWLFTFKPDFWKPPQVKALLDSVSDDHLLLLDLMCEANPAWKKTDAFCGKPWIFCIIQTFGNTVTLHGGLPQIARNLDEAMTNPKAGKLRGIGHIMEGLGYNPVVHDFLAEMTWRSDIPKLEPWIEEFAHRRYGRSHPKAREAWQYLLKTAYSLPQPVGTVICARPNLQLGSSASRLDVTRAWQLLLEAADDLQNLDTYRFDLVNVSRQALVGRAEAMYADVLAAYREKDRRKLAEAAKRFIELINDADDLLATRGEFLLGRWIADANRWATNDAERRLYEWNARNQITLWGPSDGMLHDYAEKQWSGMLRGFYGRRWQQFFDRLDSAVADDKPFDGKQFEKDIQGWEERWTHRQDPYPELPQGDSVAVSRRLWEKYGEALSKTTPRAEDPK